MFKPTPYMTDEEVSIELLAYDDVGYEDVPAWLRQELESRGMVVPRREPTELEMWDTVKDALEHRIINKELTIKDYLDKYKHGKSLTLIT
jgi:hypothetical protein